jgi:NDP-sugar pyrophosphorylase family protein
MKLNLVIPAAGMGSRFRAAGTNTPKPLIPICEIPMILWVITNFNLKPDDEIWIVSRKQDELPKNLNSFLARFPNPIHFLEISDVTDGAASTLQLVLEQVPESEAIICANSDQYISGDMTNFINSVRQGRDSGQILTMMANGNKWSYIKRDINGFVESVIEKVEVSDEATVGIYGWKSASTALKAIYEMKADNFKVNGEFYLAPSYTYIVRSGGTVSTYDVGVISSDVHGLGTPEDLELFLDNKDLNRYESKVRESLGLNP